MKVSPLVAAILMAAAFLQSKGATTTLFYGVAKGQFYQQTTAALPALVPDSASPYRGRAFVYASTPTTATVKTPQNQTFNLVAAGNHVEYGSSFPSQPPFGLAWPNGGYTLTIVSGADGTKTSAMNLSSDFYPSAPHVNNFAAAQAIAANQSFAIAWDNLGLNANDFVQVRIEQPGITIFETPALPGTAGALNGSATSVTIPANRLIQGEAYTCRITAWHFIYKDTTSIPGAVGQTAYTSETAVTLRARFDTLDVRQLGVEKRINYDQPAAALVLRTNAYEMIAFATCATAGSITGASFKSPDTLTRGLVGAGTEFAHATAFAAANLLDSAFASGAYEIRLGTLNNGNRTNTVTLAGDAYPEAARVLNIDAAQYIKSASPFTLSWTAADASADIFLQVAIKEGANTVFETPGVIGAPGALNGTAVSVVIPAGTLASGKLYSGAIRRFRPTLTDTTTYPLVPALAGYSRVTRFDLRAAAGPTPQPAFQSLRLMTNRPELTFSTIRGEFYKIQSTANFSNWTTLPAFTASGSNTVSLLPSSTLSNQYYRVLIGP